jgi:hypothetical protein
MTFSYAVGGAAGAGARGDMSLRAGAAAVVARRMSAAARGAARRIQAAGTSSRSFGAAPPRGLTETLRAPERPETGSTGDV